MYKFSIIILVLFSCGSPATPPEIKNTVTIKQQAIDSATVPKPNIPPAWLSQNIDTSACDLILSEGMEMVKVGRQYTATYNMGSPKWVKSDKRKTGLDFDYRGMPFMFNDSCALKASLRDFIRLKMVQNTSEGLYKAN